MTTPQVDDEDRIGLPRGVRVERPVPETHDTVPAGEPELREGETGLGRPPQWDTSTRPLTDDDRRRLRIAEEGEALAELALAEELTASDPAVFTWLGGMAQPLALAFLAGIVGVLGLYLYAQAVTILSAIASQPLGLQVAGYTLFGLLGFFAGYALVRFLALFLRLNLNRQVRLAGLQELHQRTRLRWLALNKTAEARDRLIRYVADYPLAAPPKRLARLGLTADVVKRLDAAKAHLISPETFASSDDWFLRFQRDFQTPLDEIASARTRYWANRAMLVTAVSPNGLIDSVSTIYFGFSMVADLCQIYHLRAGRAGTTVILGRVFFNAYLAGQLNDVESLIEEQADQVFEQAFAAVGVGVGGGVASKFLGKVGAKATTGYLNRLLLLRLGKYAQRLLRPTA